MKSALFERRSVGGFILLVLLSGFPAMQAQISPQQVNPDLLTRFWPGKWIVHPEIEGTEFGVYHYRKTIELSAIPEKLLIHVSGDNRYRLFVNGEPVLMGPARGDLDNWRFESLDIAPYLRAGENLLAAVVWNFGKWRPYAQHTLRTGFILQADDASFAAVNTDRSWRVFRNHAYKPLEHDRDKIRAFLVVGPGEEVDAGLFPWGWQQSEFSDSAWASTSEIRAGGTTGVGTNPYWQLMPRKLPPMEAKPERLATVRKVKGTSASDTFLQGNAPIVVPARTSASLILDNARLTTAYPEMVVSGGSGSSIVLTYAEAPSTAPRQKGHRDVIDGKQIVGYQDRFIADGGEKRLFRPLWFRTYRYIQLDIETGDLPLQIDDFRAEFTGYPLKERATFRSDREGLADIWRVGWHTQRLCAGETYYDCPYYEQLQYVGDTRIQALITMYVDGDDRLIRRAIEDFDDSRTPNGLTRSRYPSTFVQTIPTYSLDWISMIYDHWMHYGDLEYARSFELGIEGVVRWHQQYVREDGLLGMMPWWQFMDWVPEWRKMTRQIHGGIPPQTENGQSAILTLHFAYVLNYASALMHGFGQEARAKEYKQMADSLNAAVVRHCWDAEKGVFADTPENSTYSQHSSILAVLSGAVADDQRAAVMRRVREDNSLLQTTFYFKFYLSEALRSAGLADHYVGSLEAWQDMLDIGLTTFAERPEPTRSDCHAWSASPNYHMLSLICGIRPSKPGFREVEIAPALGSLNQISGSMPTPLGELSVELAKSGATGITGNVSLPAGVFGRFIWQSQILQLQPGLNQISLR